MVFFLRSVGHRAQTFFTNPDTTSKTDYGQVSNERTVIYTNSKKMLPEQFGKSILKWNLVLEYICTGICMNFLIHLRIQKVNHIMYVQLNKKRTNDRECLFLNINCTCNMLLTNDFHVMPSDFFLLINHTKHKTLASLVSCIVSVVFS